MSTTTGIEWTDATWNPIRGCSRVSEGCRNCYAETVANRFCKPGSPYDGVVQLDANGKGTGKWNGQIKFVEARLLDPLRWKKPPQRIFVNSMSDLFHENVTDEMLDRIFAVMALCPQHTFQVLTKRPARMLSYLKNVRTRVNVTIAIECLGFKASFVDARIEAAEDNVVNWPLPNVQLGVSVENQKAANERIPLLLQTPAAVRFISAEPLLGPIDLRNLDAHELSRAQGHEPDAEELEEPWKYSALEKSDIYWGGCGDISDGPWHSKLDWVIVGGESGPGARPMHPDWARSLRDQCGGAEVPCFFKQWGEWMNGSDFRDSARIVLNDGRVVEGDPGDLPSSDRNRWADLGACMMAPVGKKVAGRLLDGREWNEMPEVRA